VKCREQSGGSERCVCIVEAKTVYIAVKVSGIEVEVMQEFTSGV
jgi:hypothetical protein